MDWFKLTNNTLRVWGIVAFIAVGCVSNAFATVQNPMTEDLNGGGYAIFNVADVITQGPWVDIRAFGAVGDGITDDTTAIQNAIDTLFPKYSTNGTYNFYIKQQHPVLLIPKGTYRITATLDLSFRNDLLIQGIGELMYDGPNDGTVIEAKCCARFNAMNLNIDGNGKAGTFIHISGNGTSDGNPQLDRLSGKGNSSCNRFINCYFRDQNVASSKSIIDTIPHLSDTSQAWFYSMDDSEFMGCYFKTSGTTGFAISLGSSEISFFNCNFMTPNGLYLANGVTAKFYKSTFSLQADDKGAIYIAPNAHIGELSFFSCYTEGSNRPMINFDGTSTGGSVKKINIYGGLFGQRTGADYFMYIPSCAKGSINIDSPRFQSVVGKLYAPECYVNMKQVVVGTNYTDYLLNIEAKRVTGVTGSVQKDIIIRPEEKSKDFNVTIQGDVDDINSLTFSSVDKALKAMAFSKGGKITLVVNKNDTIAEDHMIRGDIRITSSASCSLTLNKKISVYGDGMLTIDNLNLHCSIDGPITNTGGTVFINTLSVSSQSAGFRLVKHLQGNSTFGTIDLNSGGLVDASYIYGAGNVSLRGITALSNNSVVSSGDQRNNINIKVFVANTPPTSGSWERGTRAVNVYPAAGSYMGWVCVGSGTPGVWKGYGEIQN